MNDYKLLHYGILGMKWGVRRTPEQLARARGEKSSSSDSKSSFTKKTTSSSSSSGKKRTSEMTEDELRSKIQRLKLEKRYKDLMKATAPPPKSTKGRDFVQRVLEKSGENIMTQLTTVVMGKAVNATIGKMLGDDSLVNPKKGQKDK